VWDRAGGIKTYEVVVRRDLTHLMEQVKQLFPGEPITVVGSGKDVVLSGTVSSKYVVDKASEVAAGYVEKKENVVNMLKQQEGVASNQVMLRVRFAEVSRSAMQELGATFFANGYKSEWAGRTAPPGVPSPDFEDGKLVFSDFLNLFVFNAKEGLGAAIKALQNKGLFQSLAEPNLIASNGKEASFLAGGEYPYPIVQPGTGGNAVTIMFKEFGIRLNFTPTVLNGDMINLKVRPEVSALDFSSAITLSGFRVPALSTRRTETEVELANGQTFAIAGLMNNTVTNTMRSIPGIGDIPILGWLFKSKAMAKNQTELVVMITPTIVRKGSMGVSEGVPSAIEPYLGAPKKTLPQPAPWTGSPKYPVNQPSGGQNRSDDAAQAQGVPQQQVSASVPATAAPMPQAPAAVPQSPAPAKAEPKPDAKELGRFREDQKRAEEAQKRAEEAQKAAEKKAADEKAAADKKAAEEQAIADKKAAEEKAEADRKAAEEKAEADKKAAAEKARQDKLDAERAKREAEVAKKNAEAEKKRQAEMKKHEKSVAEAAARLKEAQAAYQAEMDKKKGGQ
jgi:pilus assembly protein CpaC